MREEIFFGMAKAQYPILMMRSTKVSLEDVFLELTADDKMVTDETHGEDKDYDESQSEREADFEEQYGEPDLDLQEEENEEKEEQVHDSDL